MIFTGANFDKKTIFVNSLLYYIKLRTIVQRSCTGLPTKYLRKQSMRSYTTIDQVEKCCKMLQNNNQKHDFLNQLCQFVSLLCCIKLSIIVQRSYINVLTKRLRKQSTGTHITTSQTSKNRVFCFYFSTLIDRCFLDVCEVVI